MNLTKISIEKPKLAVVLFSLVVFLGITSYFYLSYELVPKFNPPVLTVTTVYPGAPPTEVENKISIKIEDALSSIEYLDQISSFSYENFSLVRLEMKAEADIDQTLQNAQRKLQMVLSRLPESARAPTLSKFDFDDLPVMRLAVFSNLSDMEMSKFAMEKIQPAFSQVPGVAEVRLLGEREREIKILVNPKMLETHRTSILQIVRAIRMSNLEIPSGKIESDKTQSFIRLAGRFEDLDELRHIVVNENTEYGFKVKVKDVAEVVDGTRDVKVISRINGKNALGIDIKKQSDANAVDMSRLVRDRIDALVAENEALQLRFEIASDTSEFTLQAARAVMEDLGLAVILVSLIMLLFLHSIRNSLIVLISIPTSIISTFVVMYLMGYSLNLLSLLGLSLAIGILVDDSIVVIENIYRHIEMGKDKVRAAYEGRMEIGFTAISITLVDVVVFLPIIFSSGLVADLLRQFSVVIVASTLMSLFVSFTLVPLLSSRFAKLEKLKNDGVAGSFLSGFESVINSMIAFIIGLLQWAFNHKVTTLAFAVALFAGSLSLIFTGFIGVEFVKSGDRSEIMIELELPKNATVRETNRLTAQVEHYLLGIPDVERVFTNIGITSSGKVEFNTSNLAEISIKLIDKAKRDYSTAFLSRKIKLDLERTIPDLKVNPVEINIIGLRDDDAVQVTFLGETTEELAGVADKVFEIMDRIPGVIEIKNSLGQSNTELNVEIDRTKMELLGIDLPQVAGTIRTAFNGNQDSKFSDQGEDYDINVILDAFDRKSVSDIEKLTVMNKKGQAIPFRQFAAIEEKPGPAIRERTNRAKSVTFKSQVIGRPAGSAGREVQLALSETQLPENVTYFFGGQTKRTMEGVLTMIIAFAISIILVYVVLVALYDSYYYPFVVLFSIPLAIVGALLALALAKQSLSIFSILGLIMLVGLVGKNAILVVDFTNNLRARGLRLKEALIEATKLRFRPILMTNITMVVGLMPIALARGAGSEWKNGLAWALIGGLSSSMFLTLIIVPVIYYLVVRGLGKMGVQWGKKVNVPQ
ncbi:MAG: efflux RND transporter permease subunit [Cytophagales bacterium]|nr:efflux RND transporter permease subunit [Cytophagales bacterium]